MLNDERRRSEMERLIENLRQMMVESKLDGAYGEDRPLRNLSSGLHAHVKVRQGCDDYMYSVLFYSPDCGVEVEVSLRFCEAGDLLEPVVSTTLCDPIDSLELMACAAQFLTETTKIVTETFEDKNAGDVFGSF
jgi:hypothetical protein